MIRISKLSGEELCALDEKGLEGLSTKYGPTVRSLKRHCKTLTDASIYRQRLLFQNEELDDDQTLAHLTAELAIGAFLELQLVLVPWQALDHPDLFKNYEKLKEAISEGSSQEVERILRIPIHPDVDENSFLAQDGFHTVKTEEMDIVYPRMFRCAYFRAAHADNPQIVGHLLDAEADPNYLCRLDTAVNNRQLEIVRLLLEARAHPDGGRAASQDSGQEEGSAYSGERHGNTPLCTAISQRDLPMIKLLLQSGCKKDHIYEDGSTALMSACEQNCDEVVKTLLQAGANVNKADSDGQTPLMECSMKNLEMVKLMMDFDADINSKDLQDRSALFLASGNGRNQVVQYLLRSRAEVDAADCRCRSPLWVAARNGHLPVVKTLVAAGARTDLTDLDGRSPVLICKRFNHLRVFKFFKDDEVSFIPRPRPTASRSTVIKSQTKGRAKAAK